MVESINGSSYQYQNYTFSSSKLTDEQKDKVLSIVSEYDPDNMSEEDKKTMFEKIKSLGVAPGEDLKNILDDAGFKPPAKPEGMPPMAEDDSENFSLLKELTSQLKSGEINKDDLLSLIKQISESEQSTQGVFVDKKA